MPQCPTCYIDSIDSSDGEDLRDYTESLYRLPLHHPTLQIPFFARAVQRVTRMELDLQVKRQYRLTDLLWNIWMKSTAGIQSNAFSVCFGF